VKLLASAAAPICALVLIAAPASAARWQPRPVDFELEPRSGALAVAAAGDAVSRPLRTHRRFNLVGLRWRGRAEPRIAVRARRQGRRWSRWARLVAHAEHNPDAGSGEPAVAASDPLWVGEADEVQYRLSRRVPGLRLHFVDVRGTATGAYRPRAAAERSLAGPAQLLEPQPDVVSREEWGADSCPPRRAPAYGEVKAVHVHHTVSLNDYSPGEAPSIVLAICRYHRNSNGWDDIGYNALVDRYGVLYEGRAGGLDRPVVGAQAQGFNDQTAGLASIGDHRVAEQPAVALEAMARFIRWKLTIHGQPTSGPVTLVSAGGSASRYPAGRRVRAERVLGHRDTGRTECPGDALYGQLDELRGLVQTGPPAASPPVALTAAVAPGTILYGRPTVASGTLLSALGAPLAGELVELQALKAGRWVTVDLLTTDSGGAWSAVVRPRANMLLRARFPGRAELPATTSPRLLLRVRPILRLARTAARAERGQILNVRGRVRPAKPLVYQVLQQRIRGSYRRVGVRAVRARHGRFRSWFIPGFSALYRVYVTTKADALTDRGRSELRVVRVRRSRGE
jgi:N-acetylmuramoyl-L-alanine amidase